MIAAALAACGNQPPDRKLIKDIGPAISWVSALEFAAEDWLGNRVPSAFMRESLKSADQVLEKARQSVDQSKASEPLRNAVAQQLRAGADAAGELKAAVTRGDRAGVGRARARLAAAYEALHRIEEQHQ